MKSDALREYVRSLSDDKLSYIVSRFKYKLAGDMCDLFDCFSSDREVGRWLSSADDSSSIFNMLDDLESVAFEEENRRIKLEQDSLVEA